MTAEMTQAIAAQLREPFAPSEIGKLPRVWCKACREAQSKNCDKHTKVRCDVCRNTITSAHLHLDYVGHAEITDRLLQVDSSWQWEPVAFTSDGVPYLDVFGGLWIRLTVAGVTRLGYGHADGKKGADAIKEAIGDALRNAAMRFGVGLDLWGAKFDDEKASAAEAEPASTATAEQESEFDELAKVLAAAETEPQLRSAWEKVVTAYKADGITTTQANQLRADLDVRKAAMAGAP